MDCILLRDRINKRITAMQNHSLDILTGLVCMLSRIIILVHVLVARLCYRDLALHFLWPNSGDCWLWGSAFLLRVFLLWGSGLLGQVIITQLLFFSHFFFNLDHFSLLLLLDVSWVGTHNKPNWKLLSGHKSIKINIARLR